MAHHNLSIILCVGPVKGFSKLSSYLGRTYDSEMYDGPCLIFSSI